MQRKHLGKSNFFYDMYIYKKKISQETSWIWIKGVYKNPTISVVFNNEKLIKIKKKSQDQDKTIVISISHCPGGPSQSHKLRKAIYKDWMGKLNTVIICKWYGSNRKTKEIVK